MSKHGLKTNNSIDPFLCTIEGVEHDFRPITYEWLGSMHTSWACIWCKGVTCGDFDEDDPCWEIYHHTIPHKTRTGITWPIGGNRP